MPCGSHSLIIIAAAVTAQSQWPADFNRALAVATAHATANRRKPGRSSKSTTSMESSRHAASALAFSALAGFALAAFVVGLAVVFVASLLAVVFVVGLAVVFVELETFAAGFVHGATTGKSRRRRKLLILKAKLTTCHGVEPIVHPRIETAAASTPNAHNSEALLGSKPTNTRACF
jgi:hypothetical protein